MIVGNPFSDTASVYSGPLIEGIKSSPVTAKADTQTKANTVQPENRAKNKNILMILAVVLLLIVCAILILKKKK